MDNQINEIRGKIRALRVSMLEAENIMREQIDRDEECSEIAGEILHMRSVMSELVRDRAALGDHDPILVSSFYIPRREPEAKRSHKQVERHLTPRS
jgi:hypothetical protein